MDDNAVDPSNDQQDEKLRYDGAAALTGLKVPTLQSMVCRRQIPHYRLGKRLVIFSKAELMAWMSQHRVDTR
jgi:excisionase family DNA binding protein